MLRIAYRLFWFLGLRKLAQGMENLFSCLPELQIISYLVGLLKHEQIERRRALESQGMLPRTYD